MDDRWWIECGRVGCDEAVGDGKNERCLTLVELELDTCWDRHPCSSAFASDWEQLFKSLSSCSRSFTWLCSFVSVASALWYDFFMSQRVSLSSSIYTCRSLICPCTHWSASILMLLMNAGQALCTAFLMSICCRVICPRLWAPSRWLMYSWQQAHPLVWWMVMFSGHPLIFQAAPWCAAIRALVSRDTGVRMTELMSIRMCGRFWDLSIFFDRRWMWWRLLRST